MPPGLHPKRGSRQRRRGAPCPNVSPCSDASTQSIGRAATKVWHGLSAAQRTPGVPRTAHASLISCGSPPRSPIKSGAKLTSRSHGFPRTLQPEPTAHAHGRGVKLPAAARVPPPLHAKDSLLKKRAEPVRLRSEAGERLMPAVHPRKVPAAVAGRLEESVRTCLWRVCALQETTMTLKRRRRWLLGKRRQASPGPQESSASRQAGGEETSA
jgi:hypothetical protein